jgi:isopentenyl-diphosphate delta-isomerase
MEGMREEPGASGGAAELVVLLDPAGAPVGQADKASVHDAPAPYHLAFSCYAFDRSGALLVTRRALAKRTWPGVWSNSCCGHPAPGEPLAAAVRRRLRDELGLEPAALRLALADFSYRARQGAVEEHELCPTFLCRVGGDPTPAPGEVAAWRWQPWATFLADARRPGGGLSPWARLQADRLEAEGHVARFLATT